jgi:hypothetical protein
MPNLITYSPDVTKLGPELEAKRPERVMKVGQDYIFRVPKTPTKRVGKETMSMVRAKPEEVSLFDGLTNVQVLGTREEVFADPAKLAIYRKFYPENSQTIEFHGQTIHVPAAEMPVFF